MLRLRRPFASLSKTTALLELLAALAERNASVILPALTRTSIAVSLRYVVHAKFTTSTLTLFYEDLLLDPARWFLVLIGYLGLAPPSAEQLDQMLRKTNAVAMRQAEAAGRLPGPNRPGQDTAKVRAAAHGAWEAEVGRELGAQMTRTMCSALVPPLNVKWHPCTGESRSAALREQSAGSRVLL